VSFSGLVVRDAGKVFTFDLLAHRVDRFVIERSEFKDVYSPAHVTEAPAQVVDHIALTDNRVERAVKGFYLPLRSIGDAGVSGNTLTHVGDAAIRLGSDNDDSFRTQRDIDVRDNVIRDVTGESDANGIKVLGGRRGDRGQRRLGRRKRRRDGQGSAASLWTGTASTTPMGSGSRVVARSPSSSGQTPSAACAARRRSP